MKALDFRKNCSGSDDIFELKYLKTLLLRAVLLNLIGKWEVAIRIKANSVCEEHAYAYPMGNL